MSFVFHHHIMIETNKISNNYLKVKTLKGLILEDSICGRIENSCALFSSR
jgi:hypothetical protein